MSNTCPDCPFVQRCKGKIAVHESYVEKLEQSITELTSETVRHAITAEELKQTLPKNWLKRFFISDDIGREQLYGNRAHETAIIYPGAQDTHRQRIGELTALVDDAPKTCSGLEFRLGKFVCTSQLNTFKNRRKP